MLGVAYSLIVGTILWDCLLGLECQQKRQDFKIVAPTVTVVTQKQVFHVPRRIAELQESNGKGQEKFHRADLANLVHDANIQYANICKPS